LYRIIKTAIGIFSQHGKSEEAQRRRRMLINYSYA
jgi:hypothetical protein